MARSGSDEKAVQIVTSSHMPAIITSALSLARVLWRYGEPELAQRAAALSPADVLTVGQRIAELGVSGDSKRYWPNSGKNAAFVLGAIWFLEGRPRPPVLQRRLPESQLPSELQATEAELWESTLPVVDLADSRRRG